MHSGLHLLKNDKAGYLDSYSVIVRDRSVASSIIGGRGYICIYSCSAQLVSFEIDCFYGLRTRIYEYVLPPIIELATGLVRELRQNYVHTLQFHFCAKSVPLNLPNTILDNFAGTGPS